MNLELTRLEIERHLAEMETLFKPHCRLTLVIRNPEKPDGGLVFSRDDPTEVIECIKRTVGVTR
jgi:hypothetical protein